MTLNFHDMAKWDAAALEGMHPEIGLFAAGLIDSTREWRGELDEVDDEAIPWTPFENGHSIGNQLIHIASVEVGWIHCSCGGMEYTDEMKERFMDEETDVDSVLWPTAPRQPLAWYYEMLDDVRAKSLEVLRSISDPDQIYKSKRSENEFTVRWMLGHTLQHDAYHGGQAVLLKLLWERRKKFLTGN